MTINQVFFVLVIGPDMLILLELDIDVFRIATDIQSKNVGKTFATDKFVKLLSVRGITPDEYICFGDDIADYDMYKTLADLGKTAKLVFVGEKEKLEGKDLKDVIFTEKKLDEGTLEYLQKNESLVPYKIVPRF